MEGDLLFLMFLHRKKISIHALRVEGDGEEIKAWLAGFNISIHALRVEGDAKDAPAEEREAYISIHALRVEGDR